MDKFKIDLLNLEENEENLDEIDETYEELEENREISAQKTFENSLEIELQSLLVVVPKTSTSQQTSESEAQTQSSKSPIHLKPSSTTKRLKESSTA